MGSYRGSTVAFAAAYVVLVVGDAAAGLGDRGGAVRAYRTAVDRDPSNWIVWLRLAQTTRGTEKARAYAEVRRLDPRERIAGTTPPAG